MRIARKIASLLLVAMLCFSTTFAVASNTMVESAYALVPTGTLTVNGPSNLTGKDVYAVQMFAAVEDGGAKYTYQLTAGWEEFFKGLGNPSMSNVAGNELSAAAYNYVLSLSNASLDEFAKKASDYARGSNAAGLSSLIKTARAQVSSNGSSAKFTDVSYGYYLVYPAKGSTSTTRHTDAMLVNVPDTNGSADVSLNIKSEYPTVDKTIVDNPTGGLDGFGIIVDGSWEGNHGMEVESLTPDAGALGANGQTANVGETVTFKLTSTVPDMTNFTSYTFKLHDILSKGLTLLNTPTDPKVVVKINGASLLGGDYTRSGLVETDGTTKLTIDLSTYLWNHKELAGKSIEVWYQAKVNDQAAIEGPNTNSAYVEYTTEPGKTEEGVHDKTFTYTFGFALDKRAGDANGKPLAGATFKVYSDTNRNGLFDNGADTVMRFSEGAGQNAGKWIVSENGAEAVTTPDSGKLNLAGFAAGTYFIEEITAPAGYNKLEAPVKVVIDATIAEDGSLTGHVIDYGEAANGIDDASGTTTTCNEHAVVIVNKSGSLLPETGGMGTIAFTVVGAAVVVGGVVWAVRRKNAQH